MENLRHFLNIYHKTFLASGHNLVICDECTDDKNFNLQIETCLCDKCRCVPCMCNGNNSKLDDSTVVYVRPK